MEDSRIRQFLAELRRRRVYRVAAVYLVVGWVILQLGNIVVEPLGLPDWTMAFLIVLVVVGFPLALLLTWAFEITPQGVRRTEPQVASPAAPSSSEPGPSPRRRISTYAGAGALLVLIFLGGYHFFGEGPGSRGGPEDASARTIAVLPFENSSPDAENEFFADGVTDDILTHLSRIADLTVPSRTTVMRYKGSPLSVSEIAEELGVEYVLEGSVRRAGDRVRISTQLVHAARDQGLWAEAYERDLEDIFAVQSDIARSIADALQAELSPTEESRIVERPTENLQAYDLFLLGRESFYRYDLEGTERAMESFREALALDPGFAQARAWLARAYAIYSYNHGGGFAWADSAIAQGREAVEQARGLSDAHSALGVALSTSGRYAEGEAALERAIALNPNDWAAIANLAVMYGSRGRVDEAIRLSRESLQREPARSALAYGNLGDFYSRLGLFDRAERSLETAIALQDGHWIAMYQLAAIDLIRSTSDGVLAAAHELVEAAGGAPRAALQAGSLLLFAGEYSAAAAVLEPAYQSTPTAIPSPYLVGVAYGYALERTGRADRASSVMAEAESYARERVAAGDEYSAYPYNLALIHFIRGEPDEGFLYLDAAVDVGWSVTQHMRLDPILDPVRDDPRYQSVLDRMEERLGPMRERVEREAR